MPLEEVLGSPVNPAGPLSDEDFLMFGAPRADPAPDSPATGLDGVRRRFGLATDLSAQGQNPDAVWPDAAAIIGTPPVPPAGLSGGVMPARPPSSQATGSSVPDGRALVDFSKYLPQAAPETPDITTGVDGIKQNFGLANDLSPHAVSTEAKWPQPAPTPAEKPSGVNPILDFFQSIPRGLVLGGMDLLQKSATVPPEGESLIGMKQAGIDPLEVRQREMTDLDDTTRKMTDPMHKPQTVGGEFGETTGEFLGNPLSYVGPGGPLVKVLGAVTSAIGSEALGQLVKGSWLEPWARYAGAFIGGHAPAAAERAVPNLRGSVRGGDANSEASARPQPGSREELQTMLDRKASPDEIEQHPIVQCAYVEARSYPSTSTMDGYGTPEWRATRRFNLGGQEATGYDAAQDYLTAQAEGYSTEGPVLNERRATIVIGPGGAGKSTLIEPLARARRAAVIDADNAKEVIPEYRGGIGADAAHKESMALMYGEGSPLLRLGQRGANLVIQTIGHDPNNLRTISDRLRAEGYTVDLVNLSVDPAEAFRRRLGRFLRTGRIGSEAYADALARSGTQPRESYYTLKDEGRFHETADIDANDRPANVLDGQGSQLAEDLGFGQFAQRRGDDGIYNPDPGLVAPGAGGTRAPGTGGTRAPGAGRPDLSAALNAASQRLLPSTPALMHQPDAPPGPPQQDSPDQPQPGRGPAAQAFERAQASRGEGDARALEAEVLRRYGFGDDDIAAMTPAQRRAHVGAAVDSGISVAPPLAPPATNMPDKHRSEIEGLIRDVHAQAHPNDVALGAQLMRGHDLGAHDAFERASIINALRSGDILPAQLASIIGPENTDAFRQAALSIGPLREDQPAIAG